MRVQYIRNGKPTVLMIITVFLVIGIMFVLALAKLDYDYGYEVIYDSFDAPCSMSEFRWTCGVTPSVVKVVYHKSGRAQYFCAEHINTFTVTEAESWNAKNNYPADMYTKLYIAGGLFLALLIPAFIWLIQILQINRGTDKRERSAKAPYYAATAGGIGVMLLGFLLCWPIVMNDGPTFFIPVLMLGGCIGGLMIIKSAQEKMKNPVQPTIEDARTEPGRVFYDLCVKNGLYDLDSEENLSKAVDILKYSGEFSYYDATKGTAKRLFRKGEQNQREKIDLEEEGAELQQVINNNRKIRESNIFGKDGAAIIEQIRRQRKPALISGSVDLILQTTGEVYYYCRTAQRRFVYARSSDTCLEKLPSIRKVGNVNVTGITSHPEEHVFTSATVGGITTGGVHTNPAWTELHYGKTETWRLTAGYGTNGTHPQATVTAAIVTDEDIKYFMYDQALKAVFHNSNYVYISSSLSKQTANRLLEVLNSIAQC